MAEFTLGERTRVKTVAIRVKDRDKMIKFYRDVVGFSLKREENELAIFGTVESQDELLWLEESPRANDHFGEIKKLKRLRLVVPIAEIGSLLKRLKQQNDCEYIPYEKAWGILTNDPEGNPLEFYYKETAEQQGAPEELLKEASDENVGLSENIRFGKVHLHTSDLQKESKFFTDLLKMTVPENLQSCDNEQFIIELTEAKGGTIDLKTHEVLGLDFLKIAVSKEDLLFLEEQLTSSGIEFYADKKKKILTVYDAIGIEWWFVTSDK